MLNRKKNYYPRIVLSHNMPEKVGCYIYGQTAHINLIYIGLPLNIYNLKNSNKSLGPHNLTNGRVPKLSPRKRETPMRHKPTGFGGYISQNHPPRTQ